MCGLVKMLHLQDGFSFKPPLSNYDINVDIDTKVEIYHIPYCVQVENLPITGKYFKDVILKTAYCFVSIFHFLNVYTYLKIWSGLFLFIFK